jgi:hypothetical protein
MVGEPNYPAPADVKQRVIAAVVKLYRYDYELLNKDANERSITHKLAEHLQHEFAYWHVDCEYNRQGGNTKRLLKLFDERICPDAIEARTVYPDINVHRRGTRQNLIVIEVKKKYGSGSQVKADKQKLKLFAEDSGYKYEHGLFLIVDPKNPTLERYQGNNIWEDWSQILCAAVKELVYGG